ncbi:unnamed protein product, partial [Ectocarpus sp. 13 AM-2016]
MVRASLLRKEVGPRERDKTTSGRGGRGGWGVLAGKRSSVISRSQAQLPEQVEAYTRTLVRRCLAMHGRAGSDVGVAVLLAQAFEINISEEERSGLRVLFRVLSTRLGAFILTGRAVPFQSQSLAARHGVLKRWSVSRIRPLRDAFQGVKRLTCSLFFSAHPEVHHKPLHLEGSGAESTAALAKMKTNPNWIDIRYDPQHHRFARNETPAVSSTGQRLNPIAAAAARPGLWSGAKVKDRVSQTARAAAAVASTAPRPSRSSSANSHSNPPSPASSLPPSFSARAAAAPSRVPGPEDVPPEFSPRPRSKSSGSAAATASAFLPSAGTTSGRASAAPTSPHGTLPQQLTVDVVVVGSGAGGGCAAGALAARGLRVAVLEKGGLYGAPDFAGFSEMEAYKNMYEGQGVLATEGGAVVILAGSCVGGGTTVNWAASFRTPRHVRLEWSRKLGLKSFEPGGSFDNALDAVCSRLKVNIENSHRAPGFPLPNASLSVNQHQSSLWNGAAASGRVPRAVPTNTKECVDCGSCLHGCAYGSKQSTHVTWLQDGLDSGNIILVPNAKASADLLMDAGRATGVEAVVTPHGGGKAAPLTVRARAVVVSGGAINTPAILLRSGLKHPMIGRHLCLHPVLAVGGVFPEDYDGEHGVGEDNPKRSTGGSMSAAAGTAGKQAR